MHMDGFQCICMYNNVVRMALVLSCKLEEAHLHYPEPKKLRGRSL